MLVFITGATSGIGKSTAKIFAQNGHNLIITGRREERLLQLKKTLEDKYDITVTTLCFDIRDADAVNKSIFSLKDKKEQIDVLVNNAGLAAGLGPIQEGDLSHWERMIDTNIKGLLYTTRIISNIMIKKRSGHI